MGINTRNNSGPSSLQSGERNKKKHLKLEKKSISFLWSLLILGSFLFFISSFWRKIDFYNLAISLLPWALLLLGLILIYFEIKESKIRNFQRKKMLRVLKKQKQDLKALFDLKKNLSLSKEDILEKEQVSSTNLIHLSNEDQKLEEANRIEREAALIKSQNGINLLLLDEEEDILQEEIKDHLPSKFEVEGEDISKFPPNWQKFLIENEGKNPVEKLNKMLENKEINSQ